MTWYEMMLALLILAVGAMLSYQIYRMVELDARHRGMKHPKWWGLFVSGGNNGNGSILIYWLFRPEALSDFSESERAILQRRRQRAILLFLLDLGLAIALIRALSSR